MGKKHRPKRSDSQYCHVDPVFKNQDVFILGGGPSLKTFDFSRLENKNVIGCNDNYLLNETYGKQIVDILYFGDQGWWSKYHGYNTVTKNGKTYKGAKQFNGPVYCSANNYIKDDKVQMLRRASSTLRSSPRIGWFQSTGGSAINLALQLGAVRIILLGFDMNPTKKKPHNYFQNLKNPKVSDAAINNHKRGVENLAKKKERSNWQPVPVLNANPDSGLNCFEKVDPDKIIRQSMDKDQESPVAAEVNAKVEKLRKESPDKEKTSEEKSETAFRKTPPDKRKNKNKNKKKKNPVKQQQTKIPPKEIPSELHVCCLAWSGTRDWGNQSLNAKYINALYNGVNKYCTLDFDFNVFVDEPNYKTYHKYAASDSINVYQFNSPTWEGCIPKLFMYSNELPFQSGRIIVMDLDTIITGSLDDMFSYAGEFITREAFRKKNASGGDMLGFPVNHNLGWIWDKVCNNTQQVLNKTGGSERYFYRSYCGAIDFWPQFYPNQYLSYKNHLKNAESLPQDCRLVSCHGRPRPHQIPDTHWLKQYWQPEVHKNA